MSVETVSPQAPVEPPDDGIRRRRWTREEYYRAAKLGLFRPEERLELLDGEIIEKMSPQLPPHASGILASADILRDAFDGGHHVRQQLPLVLDDLSEPEPDVLVVAGTRLDFLSRHPTSADVRLLVEVADTTLRLDRGRKQKAYARAGIPEYWILNLRDHRLEVYRDPAEGGYQTVLLRGEQDVVTLLGAPNATIRVADLLPPVATPEA